MLNRFRKNQLAGVLVAACLALTPTVAQGGWTAGANALTKTYKDEYRTEYDWGAHTPGINWVVDIPFIGEQTLADVGFHGGWDAGYEYELYYNFGEGVHVDDNGNNPQLITRADTGAGAKAWIKASGPGMYMAFWGFDRTEFNLVELLGLNNTLLDEEIEVPYKSGSIPFLADDRPLLNMDIPTTGIYAGRYDKLTDIDLVRLLAKIPGASKVISGKVGFARGFKGNVKFGLGAISYYQGQSNLIGQQTHVDQGVDVVSHKGQTLQVDKRTYDLDVLPQVTVGVAAHVEFNAFGFSSKTFFDPFFPAPGSSNVALAEITISLDLPVVKLPLSATAHYQVPGDSTSTGASTVDLDPINPGNVPDTGGGNQQADTAAPTASAVLLNNTSTTTAWPRKVLLSASDNTDPAPKIFYSFGNEPLTTASHRGSGFASLTLSLTGATTINYMALDASGNVQSKQTYAVSGPAVQMWDANLPDGEEVLVDQQNAITVTKKWGIKNSGNQTLTNLKAIATSSNHQLTNVPSTILVASSLRVGQQTEITISFKVPTSSSGRNHVQHWRLVDGNNAPVQVGLARNSEFWMDIVTVAPPADPNSFLDLPRNHDMADVVYNFGVNNGIIKAPAWSNRWMFRPYDGMTRAEFMKILVQTIEQPIDTSGVG
ncbi:MAG: NBR1-Ig-like domain-containing protein, partial [Psychrosphaera sp.]|nr:NBR1-Ig-like domain-containing protein [Psychrosphaera sp.]